MRTSKREVNDDDVTDLNLSVELNLEEQVLKGLLPNAEYLNVALGHVVNLAVDNRVVDND